MTKRLIDVDDGALDAARARLGIRTIRDTVHEALRIAADQRSTQLASALSVRADADQCGWRSNRVSPSRPSHTSAEVLPYVCRSVSYGHLPDV